MRAATLRVGAEVDGFLLEERIAVGGMGAIWRVSHPAHPMPLVMKAPFLGAGADVSTIVGYEVEEMVLRRLSGPHVPAFVAAGDLRRLPYIVMERIDGTLLQDRMAREGFTPDEVARIGARIAAALDDLHRQKVIHLDLKPGNVILAERGAVLIDFGLARHEDLPDLLGEETETPMGSPATIAPEQVLGDRSRPESDIFALGCILYEMATGETPFGEPVSAAGQKRRLYRPPKPPRTLKPGIPRWLQEVILRCLEVDPARRYASAGQLLLDLKNPDQVHLTARADLGRREGSPVERMRAWLAGRRVSSLPPGRLAVSRRVEAAPVFLAAVDLANGSDPLAQEVRLHVGRLMASAPGARLSCLTVLRTRLVGDDDARDAAGRTAYVARLIALRDWARGLDVPEERIGFHVIEALDPGGVILDYAIHNRVDHIVMGARSASLLRRHLGSVSSAVVAEAPCTVTVVRLKEVDAAGPPA